MHKRIPSLIIVLSAAAAALAVGFSAQGQPATSPWAALPTAAQVAHAYPERATRERVEGRGVVTCQVNARGGLDNCAITSDTPPGYGFGAATLSLTRNFRMRLPGPVAVGGNVSLPLSFRLPSGETATPPAPDGTLASPTWAAAPTPPQIAAVYPSASPQETRIHAFVVLDCTTDAQGTPGNCVAATENPGGRGFADAAKRLAPIYRLAATQAGGAAIAGAKVRLLISF